MSIDRERSGKTGKMNRHLSLFHLFAKMKYFSKINGIHFDSNELWIVGLFFIRLKLADWDDITEIEASIGDFASCGFRLYKSNKKYIHVSSIGRKWEDWEEIRDFILDKFSGIDVKACEGLWEEIIVGCKFVPVWKKPGKTYN